MLVQGRPQRTTFKWPKKIGNWGYNPTYKGYNTIYN